MQDQLAHKRPSLPLLQTTTDYVRTIKAGSTPLAICFMRDCAAAAYELAIFHGGASVGDVQHVRLEMCLAKEVYLTHTHACTRTLHDMLQQHTR